MTIEHAPSSIPRQIPFYAPYVAFYRAMKALKEQGIPRRVEPRILAQYTGVDYAPRVTAGFFSIGWTDDDGQPSDDLKRLVDAFGEDQWPSVLGDVIRRTYSFVPGDWSELTPAQLRDAFVAYVGYDAESLMSAETFFLCLIADAGISVYHPKFNRRVSRALKEAHKFLRPTIDEDIDERAETVAGDDIEKETISGRTKLNKASTIKQSNESQEKHTNRWMEHIYNLTDLLAETDMTEVENQALRILLSYARRKAQNERLRER